MAQLEVIPMVIPFPILKIQPKVVQSSSELSALAKTLKYWGNENWHNVWVDIKGERTLSLIQMQGNRHLKKARADAYKNSYKNSNVQKQWTKMCEDCELKHAKFGLVVEEKRWWCSGCAKAHDGAVDVGHKMCEDCELKQAKFGLVGGKRQWCSGCAKAHDGAVDVANKMCEDCKLKRPNFGLVVEGKKWWCSGCAKAHDGAVDVGAKMCEDCKLKHPNFGLAAEGKKWWCFGCAKAYDGAVDVRGGAKKSTKASRAI
jgi:hypothetical protein